MSPKELDCQGYAQAAVDEAGKHLQERVPAEHKARCAHKARQEDCDTKQVENVERAQTLNVDLIEQCHKAAHSAHVGTDFPFQVDYGGNQAGQCTAHKKHHKPQWRVGVVEI